ncbi:MAG: hypothetical protein JSU03_05030 [Bacteroidetes bacterium]|nr:hypothetical protein [Bacteroidota bacterium]
MNTFQIKLTLEVDNVWVEDGFKVDGKFLEYLEETIKSNVLTYAYPEEFKVKASKIENNA